MQIQAMVCLFSLGVCYSLQNLQSLCFPVVFPVVSPSVYIIVLLSRPLFCVFLFFLQQMFIDGAASLVFNTNLFCG